MQPKNMAELARAKAENARRKMNRSVAQPLPIFINNLELAKAALPLFGGTSPTDTESSSAQNQQSGDASSSSGGDTNSGGSTGNDTAQAGGDSGKQEMSPEQIADLLRQVGDLTNKVTQLTTENNTYKSKEQAKARESMGREQALEADLNDAQQTIVKMDAALKRQAVINAINGFKDVEFHDPNFVVRELSADVFDNMEVDLDNATVTVTGIENELRRIAREKDWAVKKNNRPASNGPDQQRIPRAPRGTGNPPAPASVSGNQAQSRRAALIDKFPVIAQGRARTSS